MGYSLSPPFLMSIVISLCDQASILLRVALFKSQSGDAGVQQAIGDGFTHALPDRGDALHFSCFEAFRMFRRKMSALLRVISERSATA